jgi:LPS-assembly lipoprotein
MSSYDRGRGGPRRFMPALALALLGSVAVAGCTVQPVYSARPASGSAVGQTLASIAIDPVDTRVAQDVRNKLIFYMTGGAGETSNPQYRLKLRVTSAQTALGISRTGSAPVYSVTVTASYTLTAIGSEDIILRETARGTASYDRSNQNFANIRALKDAEERAAVAAADEIRLRLASAIAAGF